MGLAAGRRLPLAFSSEMWWELLPPMFIMGGLMAVIRPLQMASFQFFEGTPILRDKTRRDINLGHMRDRELGKVSWWSKLNGSGGRDGNPNIVPGLEGLPPRDGEKKTE